MGKLKQAIFGNKKLIKEQDLGNLMQSSSQAEVQTPSLPSTTVFVVVHMSPDGLGAPVGVYSDSSKAEAARDVVEPAQIYELTLNADPESD